ncbi:MAG: winged helix-turn-helix transcriptional regulator [Sedimentisphaerales bacterium]|nr:winged helix-turn-helix transcriptional regulator [Sedimentisphaerales bacterium]
MTLDHIYCPATILKLPGLNLREKMLLSLAFKFGENGLRESNSELAGLLDIRPSRVSELLRGLEHKGYVEIKNRQSRHRVIYFRPNSKVSTELLSTGTESKEVLLSDLDVPTFDQNRNKRKKEKKRAPKATKPMCDDVNFDRFWAVYPNRVAKKDAEKAWAKLKPSPELGETILAAVERQKLTEQWTKNNGQYIPKPSTYLNGERWKDELPEPQRGDLDWLPTEDEAEAFMQEVEA